MIIEINPLKWFAKPKNAVAVPSPAAKPVLSAEETAEFKALGVPLPLVDESVQLSTPAKAVETMMSVVDDVKSVGAKFLGILETIGKAFEKGLVFAVKYLPVASTIASFIFPAEVAPLSAATAAADLLQNAIVLVEQKYAASGVQNGTGAQKAAEVLTLSQQAVTTLLADPTVKAGLAKAGITVDASYINRLISAIVTFLNLQGVTADTTAAVVAPVAKTA